MKPEMLLVFATDAPKFNLETPVVLLSSPSLRELLVLPLVRCLPAERTVTLDGMCEWLL